jgi:hypothetical protein
VIEEERIGDINHVSSQGKAALNPDVSSYWLFIDRSKLLPNDYGFVEGLTSIKGVGINNCMKPCFCIILKEQF